ncbi:MAG: putative LPS assembly protein LptD [Gemmatimonadota bacterium]
MTARQLVRRRSLALATLVWAGLTLTLAGAVQAQEALPRPVKPRANIPRSEIERERARFALPDDSLRAPAQDSARGPNLAERRNELTQEGFPSRDSLFQTLMRVPGFEAVEYRGDEVRLAVPRQSIRLGGKAQLNRGEQVLTADTIRYLGEDRFLWARGGITMTGANQMEVKSDSVAFYDLDRLKGTIFEAESSIAVSGTEWRVFGNVIPVSQDTLYANKSGFTSCDQEEPHYTFRTGHLKVVSQNVIVAWPVVLYVANVPVLWLPFFAQDIRPGRRSGILPPRFGFNDIIRTSDGFSRHISDFGYYWAISPYLDAQATVDWFSGNYTRLNGSFRYRFLKKFMRGSVSASRTFGSSGNNTALSFVHDQELGLRTTLRASGRYVRDTRLLQDRSFDPTLQTQTIDSDVGLTHRTSAVNLSASARRQQFLSTDNRVESTLPSVSLSFSPITLIGARSVSGRLIWTGATRFSRRSSVRDSADDQTTSTASLTNSFRLGQFNLRSTGDFDDLSVTPLDPANPTLSPRTTIRWRSSANYQLDLFGSTRLSPTYSLEGGWFKSQDTANDFVAIPRRSSAGARLSTDLYGFYPGFGPLTRIRHKISPSFTWSYVPEVAVDSAQLAIPNFPGTNGNARNLLRITLRQTFEAKVRAARPDSVGAAGEAGPVLGPVAEPAPDSVSEPDTQPGAQDAAPRRRQVERSLTLLAINSSGIEFDFERAKLDEPALITERLTNSVSSDLLRGLSLNMTHDLFEGSGPTRDFSPFLSRLSASFSIRGSGGRSFVPNNRDAGRDPFLDQRVSSRDELSRFDSARSPRARGDQSWSLSLSYSLLRVRPTEPGQKRQTVEGNLSFHPSPNWSARWSTQYDFTTKEFGQQFITLDRDLHRWQASFQFARSPNGNVLFQVILQLRDAPELKIDYDQRTDPPIR